MVKKFIWITTDHQLYQPHMDLNPQFRLKNFERLKQQGCYFPKDYCPMPICAPSRSSMITGVYPHKHGIIGNGFGNYGETDHCVKELDPNLPFFNKVMKEKGFRTGWFGKWHCGLHTAPQDAGFEGLRQEGFGNIYSCPEYHEYLEKNHLPMPRVKVEWSARLLPGVGKEFTYGEKTDGLEHPYESCGQMLTPKEGHEAYFIVDQACNWIRSLDKEEPFVVKIEFYGPHHPYDVAEPFYGTIDPDSIVFSPSFQQVLDETMPDTYRSSVRRWPFLQNNTMTEKQWRMLMARAYEHSMMVDDAWGRVLDLVEELGIADETAIIMTSDHGDSVGSHSGLFNKDCIMAEETVRVPLVVAGPGVQPGTVDNRLASGLDIVPTIFEMAGIDAPEEWDGQSLFSKEERDCVMVEEYGENRVNQFQRLLVMGDYRYVAHLDEVDEFYDLKKDPYQSYNQLFDLENAEALRRMRQRLLKEMTALKDDSSFSERLKEQIQAKLDGAGEYAFIEATRVTFDYM